MRPVKLPSLSVIIPCYNGSRFVCDAVQSVVDQAASGIECIVVDDGSTDASAELVETRFGDHIQVIRQPNRGVAAARNRGFEAARGELIVWLDADDVLTPDTLEERRAAFVDDPVLEMLVGQVRVVDIDTGAEEVTPQRCEADYLLRDLLYLTNLPHTNILTFRADAVRRVGLYDGALQIVDDFDFWLRAWPQLRWQFVRRIYSMQRTGSFPSLTRSRGKVFHYEQVGRALVKNRRLIGSVSGSDRAWRQAYAHYAAGFARLHLHQSNKPQARRWAVRALRLAPFAGDARTMRYLLKSTLPAAVCQLGRSTLARLGVRSGANAVQRSSR